MVRRGGECLVQVEEKLIREALDGRRLTERETEPDRLLQVDSIGMNALVQEQGDEATAARMRPNIRAKDVPQFAVRLEGRFALTDPLNDAVAPLPVRNESKILLDEIDGEIHLP